jgi:hypothetical protein
MFSAEQESRIAAGAWPWKPWDWREPACDDPRVKRAGGSGETFLAATPLQLSNSHWMNDFTSSLAETFLSTLNPKRRRPMKVDTM